MVKTLSIARTASESSLSFPVDRKNYFTHLKAESECNFKQLGDKSRNCKNKTLIIMSVVDQYLSRSTRHRQLDTESPGPRCFIIYCSSILLPQKTREFQAFAPLYGR